LQGGGEGKKEDVLGRSGGSAVLLGNHTYLFLTNATDDEAFYSHNRGGMKRFKERGKEPLFPEREAKGMKRAIPQRSAKAKVNQGREGLGG